MKHWRFLLLLMALAMTISALSQELKAQPQPPNPPNYDPCATAFKRSFAVSLGGAATVLGVKGDPNNVYPINICSESIVVPTASTFALVSGKSVSTPCDTNQQFVTGVYTSAPMPTSGGNAIATVPSGYDLCVKTTGSGAQGVVSYVNFEGNFVPSMTASFTPTPTKTPTATPT